jgi:hypothetical protein
MKGSKKEIWEGKKRNTNTRQDKTRQETTYQDNKERKSNII